MNFLPFMILGILITGGVFVTVEVATWAVNYWQMIFIYIAGIFSIGALVGLAIYKMVD